MMTTDSSAAERRAERELSAALERVLGPARRRDLHEIVSTETGRRVSPRQVLSWMRLNMPTTAGWVDEALA
ncbi:MAG: hypothetical protein HKL90_08380 [Elusimicrobia bacterium]|nr:hypothetical protein [Elusimicrobiota bacterium]